MRYSDYYGSFFLRSFINVCRLFQKSFDSEELSTEMCFKCYKFFPISRLPGHIQVCNGALKELTSTTPVTEKSDEEPTFVMLDSPDVRVSVTCETERSNSC